ncbi:MAG TPA: hypothetical protein VGN17_03730 [Bryobacteraceae bacterium]|jgi:hypothetical protein
MKDAPSEPHAKPISIPPDIAARCDGPDQFHNFDALVSALIAVPKSAIVKEEKKYQRKRARIKRSKTHSE